MTFTEDRTGQRETAAPLANAFEMTVERFLVSAGLFVPIDIADTEQQWWASGDPVQVLLGLGSDGMVLVATPKYEWHSQDLILRAHNPLVTAGFDDLCQKVTRVTQSRRRSFRYCTQCRHLTPPESLNTDPRLCDDCAAVNGVVF